MNDVQSQRTAPALIGAQLIEGYEIVELLGEGAMGAVYLARQAKIEQTIAIKVLHEETAEDHESLHRFYREARVVSKLAHPNIIRVFFFSETDEGMPFLATEYIDGVSLRERLDGGLLDELVVLKIMKQAASAIYAAHEFGIIHRDLKPDNILLTEYRGEEHFVKILDFGLAKFQDPLQASKQLTQTGIVYGTPQYMSPEQAQGMELDGRADIYSLGGILYELLTGQQPYRAQTAVKLLQMHVFDPVPVPSELAGHRCGPALDRIVTRAMAKEPDDRFADAMELYQALSEREAEVLAERGLDPRSSYTPGSELSEIARRTSGAGAQTSSDEEGGDAADGPLGFLSGLATPSVVLALAAVVAFETFVVLVLLVALLAS
jgi:serine/threonine-protein kinase